MFEDIPIGLTRAINSLPSNPKFRDRFDHIAAAMVIYVFIGDEYIQEHKTPLFVRTSDEDKKYDYHEAAWTRIVGETIFLLRNCSSFLEIMRRLRTKNSPTMIHEMLVARKFYRSGYDIQFGTESLGFGKDFDFKAVSENETINVEVTSFTGDKFSKNTIESTIKHKRKQLDPSNPCILYCNYPEKWKSQLDVEFALRQIGNIQLRGTRRINAIAFSHRCHVNEPGNAYSGAIILKDDIILNSNPRHKIKSVDFLFGGIKASNGLRAAFNGKGTLMKYKDELNDNEYGEWIKYALSPEMTEWFKKNPVKSD